MSRWWTTLGQIDEIKGLVGIGQLFGGGDRKIGGDRRSLGSGAGDLHRFGGNIDGAVLGNEPYTHSWLQAVRQSRLVRELVYPRMLRRIYQTDKPYITADERKLDQRDLQQIDEILPITDRQYFLLVLGRLTRWEYQAIFDRLILKLPFTGHFLAGRVVFSGRCPSR